MTSPAPRNTSLRRSGSAKQRGRPPGATAEDTVKRIIEAAQEQFGMHGYSGARMTEIASEAGITHSSIYQYFASKRELYQAAFEAALAQLLPEYLDATATQDTLRGRISAIMRASARAHERAPAITPFLASLPVELRRHPDLMPALQESGENLVTSLAAMFAHARETGEIAPDIPDRELLIGFVGAAMGIGLLSYALPDGDMAAAVEVLIAGLDGTLFRS
ncbi:TetR/AcrR family transcriptional regulator [Mycobacterium sp. 94-17]|uniref:TetR/AcrR family transcriptional regulator n=1 Tax=Mycobacterium sp. 94-17 TaxID=2986147 RepID=UPI002D1F6D4C|nr:TetR/AcrR family transcriptional regulator [Mycobacterium sp. 94-17]MEB4209546.1 TetR/AcrR family transcriptional regulator [Mycobacterium sp. 94-17]